MAELLGAGTAFAVPSLGISAGAALILGAVEAVETIIAITVGVFLIADGISRLQGGETVVKHLFGGDPFSDKNLNGPLG